MLANGARLYYKRKSGTPSAYTELAGLKELPEIGVDPEKVENTCLTDSVKQYENGIGDPGDMTYKFKYQNKSASDSFRVLRFLELHNETASFKETMADGTTIEFDAQVATKISGGGVNAAMEFDAAMSLQSNLTITPGPTGATGETAPV